MTLPALWQAIFRTYSPDCMPRMHSHSPIAGKRLLLRNVRLLVVRTLHRDRHHENMYVLSPPDFADSQGTACWASTLSRPLGWTYNHAFRGYGQQCMIGGLLWHPLVCCPSCNAIDRCTSTQGTLSVPDSSRQIVANVQQSRAIYYKPTFKRWR